MGGGVPKLLLPVPGDGLEPVLARTLRNALDSGVLRELVLVLGPRPGTYLRALAPWLSHPAMRPVSNAQAASGRASSIQAGLVHADPRAVHALILCGDQPGIGPGLMRRLVEFHVAGGFPASFPVYPDGRKGYPVVWSRDTWPRLARLRGDRGGLEVLRRFGDRLGRLPLDPVEEEGQADLDTPEDYEAWRKRAGA